MGLRHERRLFLTESDDSINATLVCKPLCDPLNTSGFCFISCFAICPTVCHYPFPAGAVIPPPPEYSAFYDADSPSNSHHISPLLITTLVALTLTILLIAAFVLFNYFRRRSSSRRSIIQSHRAAPPPNDEEFLEQGPVLDHPIWYIRTVGLPPSLISKISLCKYKNGDGLVEGTECSVCLTEFEEDETLRLLPKCSHAFHVSCIDTWLRSHTNCPNCRAPIVTNMDPSPSPEPITENLHVIRLDDIGDENSDDDGLSSREIENTSQDVVTETQVEVEADVSEDERSRKTHVVEQEVNTSTSMLPIRRSVSVDSLSASKIGIVIADFLALRRLESTTTQKDKIRLGEEYQRDNSSSSTGSSSSIKRSLSLSGRFFLSKYSLSRSSVLPR